MTDYERAKFEALAYFLTKEILRHQKDIVRASEDLLKLQAKGIKIPKFNEVDADAWIEA